MNKSLPHKNHISCYILKLLGMINKINFPVKKFEIFLPAF